MKCFTMIVVALSTVLLFGCSRAHMAGRPDRFHSRTALIEAMEGDATNRIDKLVSSYHTANADKRAIRDTIIQRSIILIDQHYSLFVDEFSGGKKAWDSGADIASMATAAVAVLVTPPLTKSILAAASGGITAAKGSIDKNFLYDQTVLVLIKQMEAQRTATVVALIRGSGKSVEEYSLAAALADIERYYFAGTFDGAMSAMQQNAAEDKQEADAELAALRRTIGESLDCKRKRSAAVYAIMSAAKAADRAAALAPLIQAITDRAETEAGDTILTEIENARLNQSKREGAARPASMNMDEAIGYVRITADAKAIGDIVGGLECELGITITVE